MSNTIINNYIEALAARAEMEGDGKLDYAMGLLYSTFTTLKLQPFELEILEEYTRYLKKSASKA